MNKSLLIIATYALIFPATIFSFENKQQHIDNVESKTSMSKSMRDIVKTGYEEGNYLKKFRSVAQMNEVQKKFLDLLLSYLPKSGEVIDLGCGAGIPFDQYLVTNGLNVTGYDFASNHIIAAKNNVPQAIFKEADFTKFEYEHETIDGIIALYSIFHIPKQEHEALFERMHAALKPGGVIVMNLGTSKTENRESDFCGAKKMLWSNYTPEYYKELLSKHAFNIIHEQFETFPGDKENHYWVLVQKSEYKK